jgi:hypothetical protein
VTEEAEQAKTAWEEARNASEKAKKAAERARKKADEALAHFNKCYDLERAAWVAMKDAEWVVTRGKGGKVLDIQRQPIDANAQGSALELE